ATPTPHLTPLPLHALFRSIFVNTLGHTPALARDDRPGAMTIAVEPTDLATLTPWRKARPSARYDVAAAVRQGADLWTIDEDGSRSEDQTSELQSRENLVCR